MTSECKVDLELRALLAVQLMDAVTHFLNNSMHTSMSSLSCSLSKSFWAESDRHRPQSARGLAGFLLTTYEKYLTAVARFCLPPSV